MDKPVTFHPFSAIHAAVIVVFVLLTFTLIAVGRRWRGTPRGRGLDVALATFCLIVWAVINAWWLLPAHFDPAVSLPIHICDVTALVAPIALLRPARTLRAILYFWGLVLSVQGFIQPDLRDGPAKVGFWFFWANHYVVVGVALFDLFARGYRPGWRDFGIAVAWGFVYLAIVFPIDAIFGLNYGYVGPANPVQPTLMDHFGPWPQRVPLLVALAIAAMAVMVLPWELRRRTRMTKTRMTSRMTNDRNQNDESMTNDQ